MSEGTPATRVLADRYELIDRVGRGGMADVYEARDLELERRVAVKALLAKHAGDPSFVARFRREAKAAAKLNHPNIVAVYDWGNEGETYFIVMEFVEGMDLADRLLVSRLSVDETVKVAAQVAAALSAAHTQGMVHRDIKPGNIMLSPDGTAKVADFGIARALEGDADLTETGKVVGTATYFSPEQAQGFAVGPSSDLYALGVVMFEMATGTPPFSGSGPGMVALKHVEERPPLASQRHSGVSAGLDAVIDRLLAKEPTDRYAGAGALAQDLERLLRGEAPLASRPAGGVAADAPDATSVIDGVPGRDLAPTAIQPEAHRPSASGDSGAPLAAEPTSGSGPTRGGVFVAVMTLLLVAAVALIFVVASQLGGEDGPGDDDTSTTAQTPGLPTPSTPDQGNVETTSPQSSVPDTDSSAQSTDTSATTSTETSASSTTSTRAATTSTTAESTTSTTETPASSGPPTSAEPLAT